MNLGIVGLPQVGKKTVFQILTGLLPDKAPRKSGITYGVAPVRDPRVDWLSSIYHPRRTRYAEFEIALPPDITPDASRSAAWLDPLRQVDAFIHVVRTFDSPTAFHILGNVDPKRDIELVETELLFADLELVEKRLERMARERDRKHETRREQEKKLLEQFKDHLEGEQSLRTFKFSPDQKEIAANLQLMTIKPMITVFNSSDELPEQESRQKWEKLAGQLEQNGEQCLFLNAEIENEISELEETEQAAFMDALGISEPASHRLSRAAYQSLGLISFFTVGQDEVKAWSLRRGATAPEAGGRIHSDLERGFIRAETISYPELYEAGSESAAKTANLFQLKGKDYQVRDGDIINIRFNV